VAGECRKGLTQGVAVGVVAPELGRVRPVARRAGQGCGACQRSSTRRRRPSPATDRGRHAGSQAGCQGEWMRRGELRGGGASDIRP
jgi:hypothetical protein